MAIIGAPQVAIAAFDATNADKVDGRHAVGAATAPADRAGKLVAANSVGVLPNSIIAKAPNADRLDTLDSTALQRRITGTCEPGSTVTALAADGSVTCAADAINAGNAQTLDGVDGPALQARVTATCPEGRRATGIPADGAITCAVDGANGGDAQTLDGVDAAQLQAKFTRTVVVGAVGTAVENGAALAAGLASIPTSGDDGASAANPWLLRIEPGTYQLADTLALPNGVDLEGSGTKTIVTCACAANVIGATAATIAIEAPSAHVRGLTVRNTGGGGGRSYALHAVTPSTLTDVTAEASGGSFDSVGIYLTGTGMASIRRATVTVSGSGVSSGIVSNTSLTSIRDSDVTATASSWTYGVLLQGAFGVSAISDIQRTTVIVGGGTDNNSALRVAQQGGVRIDHSTFSASGGGASTIDAAVDRSVFVSSTRLAGPVHGGGAGGTLACVHAFNASYVELTVACAEPA